LRNDRIDAPCLFDGPINGERFLAYVEQFLTPTLKPGDVVILDNLGSHKEKAVRQAIRAAGARLVFLQLALVSPPLNGPLRRLSGRWASGALALLGTMPNAPTSPLERTADAVNHPVEETTLNLVLEVITR
jgi:hypothetical protein